MHYYLPYLAIIATTCIFGFSFIFTKEALSVLEPFQLLGFRFAIAAFLLTVLKYLKLIQLDYKEKPIKNILLIAAFQPFLYFTFETLGLKISTASEAGIIIALVPIIVACLGAIFLKEYPSKTQVFFIFLSVSGVIFIVLMQNTLQVSSKFMGKILLFGAVISSAIFNILSRKNSQDFKPLEITYVMMWVGAILFNSISIVQALIEQKSFVDYFLALKDIRAYSAVLYLGILSSVVAFFMYNYSLAHIPASQVAVFVNLITVISVTSGVIILKENFYWYQILGGFFIILGVWGTNRFANVDSNVERHSKSI